MEDTTTLRHNPRLIWVEAFLSLLPLWLISLAITGEGFPSPPLSFELGKWLIALALPLGLLMLWKRWLSAALFLYSLAPLTFLFIFDEISTTYKTPFILLSTLILTLGVLAFHGCRTQKQRILVLSVALAITWFFASNATFRFWEMTDQLGYVECFPDYTGCAPLPDDATPWWRLFFSL
jgi:hypothetical protein